MQKELMIISEEDIKQLSRCKNFTLNKSTGRGSNIKYLPYIKQLIEI